MALNFAEVELSTAMEPLGLHRSKSLQESLRALDAPFYRLISFMYPERQGFWARFYAWRDSWSSVTYLIHDAPRFQVRRLASAPIDVLVGAL